MANNLFVSYRPSSPERDLTGLTNAIASLGGHTQIQDLFWYVNSQKTADVALEVIRDNIDPSDTLIVIDASNNKYAMNRILREEVELRLAHVWD